MRILAISCLLCFSGLGYANDSIQEIYQKGREIVSENTSEIDDEVLLFELYSSAIATFDQETLKENPELVFRKDLAWFEMLGAEENFEKVKKGLALLYDDFEFVMQNVPVDSKLYSASKFRKDLIKHLFDGNPQQIEDLPQLVFSYLELFLRQLSPGSNATGKKLREEIVLNVKRSKVMHDSFAQLIILIQDDPEVVLGYIPLEEIKLLDIDSEKGMLSYRISYDIVDCEITIESEI